MIMFSRILLCLIISLNLMYANDAKESKVKQDKHKKDSMQLDKDSTDIFDVIEDKHTIKIRHSIERMQHVKDSMREVYERERIYTLEPQNYSVEDLQIGINDAQNKVQREQAKHKLENSEYKTQLFLGVQLGATFAAVADNVNVLPTINLKVGFQNFLGITSKQIGLKIYIDTLIASNILSSLKNDPYADFIASTFNAININAEVMYEFPISNDMKFGIGAGFGIGYMTYNDKYWDKLNGFASNITLLTYISFHEKHKLELGFKTFIYHYGSYITRKLNDVVQNPSNIFSSDFAKPMNLSLGWVYVF
ncbi:hypothetical protein [Helicobacter trogontum]|uniref:Outer membrane beta-barrel protein n=1 Tax=Helicobacter trogontum TaxID=50960 RepID=A0A4U8TH20_9HELI|nr:hypothetical protein [Helicobacter trogontum]MDY5185281.1 hypothetical protein [Helicobacter trogontum]TLD98974.1 hypothetical protein LS80_002980 [Helicobacter trogontum]